MTPLFPKFAGPENPLLLCDAVPDKAMFVEDGHPVPVPPPDPWQAVTRRVPLPVRPFEFTVTTTSASFVASAGV
jgi:hypothetical protein